MSVGDVLDGAFKLFKANARTILLIVAAIVVPLQHISGFVVRDQLSTGFLDAFRDPTLLEASSESANLGGAVTSIVTALLALLVTPFIAGAVSQVVAASYVGQRLEPGAALRISLRRFPALLGSFVLVHLAELFGFILCIVPGLVLMSLFTVVAPAIAIEGLGPIKGMQRSWRLIRPRLWPTLGISLLAGLMASVLSNVLGGIPTALGALFGGSFAWLLVAVGGVLSQLVAAPIVAIVATLLYFDARIRHEGFDLELMARQLERAPR